MKKINFEGLPSTNTPISPDNLNEMQDNIEESAVVVSATQPTTNEKVWIQKGKNFLKSSLLQQGALNGITGLIVRDSEVFNSRICVSNPLFLPKGTYTLSYSKLTMCAVYRFNGAKIIYSSDQNQPWNVGNKTFELTEDGYITIAFRNTEGTEITINDIEEVQIEQGSTATEYEPHIDSNKIYTKNANGEFELFMEEDVVVSASEPTSNRAKVWMQKGKNLYNKNNIMVGMSISSSDGKLSPSTTHYFCGYIPVMPNTTYSRSNVGTYGVVFLDKNKNYLSSFTGETYTIPFTTPNNCYYVGFNMTVDKYNDESYKTFFIIQGAKATYEEYVEPKIHVKNDNGVYEEFVKEETIDFQAEVVFNEIIGSFNQFRKYKKLISIAYQGENKTHAQNEVLLTIPQKYAPKKTLSVPFTGYGAVYGSIIISNEGVVTIGQINSTTISARIVFGLNYILD